MYVVTVTFHINEAQIDKFMPMMLDNARSSLELETDCLQFDVCVLDNAPHIIYLYEVYTNRAAFDEHLASSHFKQFDMAVSTMVQSKTVQTMVRVSP